MLEAAAIALPGLALVEQQLDHFADQVVEIERAAPPQLGLVEGIGLGHPSLVRAHRRALERRGIDQSVLGARDPMQHVGGAQHALRQAEPRPEVAKQRLLCQLHVKQQVANVAHTTIVQNAWDRGQALSVQGWIYDIHDGLIDDLGVCVEGPNQVSPIYRMVEGDDETSRRDGTPAPGGKA